MSARSSSSSRLKISARNINHEEQCSTRRSRMKKKSSMAINIAQLEACEDDDCEKELGKGHKFKLKRGPEIIK